MVYSNENPKMSILHPELAVPSLIKCSLFGQWPDDARWHGLQVKLPLPYRCNLIHSGPNTLPLYGRWNPNERVVDLIEFGDLQLFPNGTTALVPTNIELQLPNTQVIITARGLIYVQNDLFSDSRVSTLLLSLVMQSKGKSLVSTR